MTRKTIFDAIRADKGALSQTDVAVLDAALDRIGLRRDELPPPRHINAAGLNIIRTCEGCKLKAYPDPGTGGAPWTIGYGSTFNVTPGMVITQDEAEARLINDLRHFEQGVQKLAPTATDNQFSAMVSLAFNIGLANFGGSTLLKRHNAGKYDAAKAEFAKWTHAAGHVLPGLVKRRGLEADLYGRA